MNLGYAFKEARLKRFPNGEKRQYKIAEEAGISQTFLSQIESGSKTPSVEVINALCKIYQIPPAILFWMALEPRDINKKKINAFNAIKGPMNHLVNEFFF